MKMFRSIIEYIKENPITFGMLIVLVIGAALRFKGLTFQSYWLDEIFSIRTSSPDKSFIEMYDSTIKDVHPAFYQSLLWGCYKLFGFTEFTGRALSAFLGTISIFAIYLLGKEFFNKEVGLYAATIASMNHFLIYYSQEVRSYSLLFLLSTGSYLCLLRVLNNYSKHYFILYLVFTIALLNTHFFGFFFVGTQVFVFIFFFIKEKNKRKLLATLAVITAICAIISLLPLIQEIVRHMKRAEIWIQMPSPWFALDYMGLYVKSLYLEIIFFITISISLTYLFRKQVNNAYQRSIVVLLLWVSMGYLLPYVRSVTAIPILMPRYTIIVIPALILLISYGIYLLRNLRLKIVSIGVIAFLSIYQLNTSNYYNKVTKQQLREVLYEIAASKEPIPVFDVIWGGGRYNGYSLMLDLNLEISNRSDLRGNYKAGLLPKCFFIADGPWDHRKKLKLLQNKAITKVLEINKGKITAVLYSYKTPPQICSQQYSGVVGYKTTP